MYCKPNLTCHCFVNKVLVAPRHALQLSYYEGIAEQCAIKLKLFVVWPFKR